MAVHCIAQRCSHSDLQNMESLGDRSWEKTARTNKHITHTQMDGNIQGCGRGIQTQFRGVGHVNSGAQCVAYMWAGLALTIKSWATCGRQRVRVMGLQEGLRAGREVVRTSHKGQLLLVCGVRASCVRASSREVVGTSRRGIGHEAQSGFERRLNLGCVGKSCRDPHLHLTT